MSGLAHTNGRGSKQALVRDEILGMLDELRVGDALPSERRLASELGVSRPTLRAVIDELVREGLLLRRHGSGTYVAEPKIALPLTMTSFSEDMARRGMRPSSRVVGFERQSAGAKLGQRLQISPVDEVFVITRLRLADDETMAIEWLHAPRQPAARPAPRGARHPLVLRAAARAPGDRDRLGHADDRTDGDQPRGG